LIATKPVDFRKGADGLAALVRETLGDDPFSGSIYVFRSKRADRVKMLAWMAPGWCFCGSGLKVVRSNGRQLATV
jgi:transposase